MLYTCPEITHSTRIGQRFGFRYLQRYMDYYSAECAFERPADFSVQCTTPFGVRRVSRRFEIFRIAVRPRTFGVLQFIAALGYFGMRHIPVPL